MKKYLLSLLAIPFLMVGFSNAQFTTDIIITESKSMSSYSSFYGLSDYGITYNITCPNGNCGALAIQGTLSYENFWSYYNLDCSNGCVFEPDTSLRYRFYCSGSPCNFNYSYPLTVEYLPVSTLNPVITGLSNTISEFGPYLVYISLGILGVIVGFVAVKWLMNRTRSKVLGTFKSRKK